MAHSIAAIGLAAHARIGRLGCPPAALSTAALSTVWWTGWQPPDGQRALAPAGRLSS